MSEYQMTFSEEEWSTLTGLIAIYLVMNPKGDFWSKVATLGNKCRETIAQNGGDSTHA